MCRCLDILTEQYQLSDTYVDYRDLQMIIHIYHSIPQYKTMHNLTYNAPANILLGGGGGVN